MGFSIVVLWWEEWQLRILVLSSLFLQYFLCFAAPRRKRSIPQFLRFIIWLAYLGSDAVSVYALATLFNRHKNTGEEGSRALEVLWAPVLLLHLAGQDTITAYNIEDNELWRRQVITMISQVTVAVYVFCKSWSGEDDRLLSVAILLFIAGIIKCIDKPMSLKSASIYSLVSQSPAAVGKVAAVDDQGKKVSSLEDYIRQAKDCFETIEVAHDQEQHVTVALPSLPFQPYLLFADLACTYHRRLTILRSFLGLDNSGAFMVLRVGLHSTFSRLYTKGCVHLSSHAYSSLESDLKSLFALLSRFLAILLTFATIGLFHHSHKQGYDDSDIKVTYTLLSCTAALELFGLYSITSSMEGDDNEIPSSTWPDRVAQYNLIASYARNRNPTNLLKLASFFGCKDYVNQHCFTEQCSSSFAIIKLVIDQVKEDGWKKYIKDTATYWMFNDRRGQLTIQQEGCGDDKLRRTLEAPFDDTILVWHIATEMCFYEGAGCHHHHKAVNSCREISNYMVHLLVAHPDMLMAGTRASTFSDARKEVKEMFKDEDAPKAIGDLTREILRRRSRETLQDDAHETEAFIPRASNLATQLLALNGEKRWRVIQGVWVEMLCFSASRCRGYLHAKSLGMGGEFLTYVWLLLSHLGMETVPERQQRSDLGRTRRPEIDEDEEEDGDAARAPGELLAGVDIV